MKTVVTEESIKLALNNLSKWACAAYAVRCAHRVQPLFAFNWGNVPAEQIQIINDAISHCADIAGSPDVVTKPNKHGLATLGVSVNHAANLTTGASRESGMTAYYAIEATRYARINNISQCRNYAGKAAMSAIGLSLKATSETIIPIRADIIDRDKLIKMLSKDMETIVSHNASADQHVGVSQNIFGEMWPDGWPKVVTTQKSQEKIGASEYDQLELRFDQFEAKMDERAEEEIKNREKQVEGLVDEQTLRFKKLSTSLEEKNKKADQIQAKMIETQKTITELHEGVSLSVYAQNFRKQKRWYIGFSVLWFFATIAILVATGFIVLNLFINHIPVNASNSILVFTTISRVVVVSLLTYAIVFCSRNFRSSSHLATTASHRCLAIQTFEAFSKKAHDDSTKDAVLLAATRCVFDHVSSGMIGKEEKSPQSQFIEIIKNSASSGGSST